MLKPHSHHPERMAMVEQAYASPSLYDLSLQLLARRGFALPTELVQRDWREKHQASEAVEQAWLEVYRNASAHWDLYQLAEELTDLEDAFRLWRFRHLTTVERVIGFKRGTRGHQRRGLFAWYVGRGVVPRNLEFAHAALKRDGVWGIAVAAKRCASLPIHPVCLAGGVA